MNVILFDLVGAASAHKESKSSWLEKEKIRVAYGG